LYFVKWKCAIPWFLLVCELVVLVWLFGMLLMAGISAGFEWWPMPTTLAVGWVFAAGCIFSARSHSKGQRWFIWTIAVLPAAYFSFFIAEDSWQMSHPTKQVWIIPAGYHGPIHVARGVPQGAVATRSRDEMVFVLDDAGIAAVREAPDTGWVKSTYEYRSSNGVITQIPEAAQGSIDDTPANRQDNTRRIYFESSGGYADGPNCTYQVNEAYVESPHEALVESSTLQQVGTQQDNFLKQLKLRYPGQCSVTK
jgi:hypothetical protein